ncbi:hypothetical protein HYS31_04670 [Candidatus Woesearchaeota archaeon]|nr:hypothetical protein [Candidatus Woesearchaeota archaeon]
MQTQEYIAATEKQLRFIQNLQKRGFVDGEVDFENLTKREASEVINAGLAEAKNRALQEEEHEPEFKDAGTYIGKLHKQIDGVRLGLSAKLVYSNSPPDLSRNDSKAKGFKSAVKRLYNILGELENEMAVE